jgi:hypothetical protein
MAEQITPEVQTYEDEFPKHLGPPPVVNYTGAKLCDSTKPVYTVELDAGAFRVLWELLEAEAKHRYPTHRSMSAARAYLRAVQVFRTAFWAVNEVPAAPETPRPRKRLARTSRKS